MVEAWNVMAEKIVGSLQGLWTQQIFEALGNDVFQ